MPLFTCGGLVLGLGFKNLVLFTLLSESVFFCARYDRGSVGGNQNSSTCKAPVKSPPPTCQYSVPYGQQCQKTIALNPLCLSVHQTLPGDRKIELTLEPVCFLYIFIYCAPILTTFDRLLLKELPNK